MERNKRRVRKRKDAEPRLHWTCHRREDGTRWWSGEIKRTGFELPTIEHTPGRARPWTVDFFNVDDCRYHRRSFHAWADAEAFARKAARLDVLDWLDGSRRALEALA